MFLTNPTTLKAVQTTIDHFLCGHKKGCDKASFALILNMGSTSKHLSNKSYASNGNSTCSTKSSGGVVLPVAFFALLLLLLLLLLELVLLELLLRLFPPFTGANISADDAKDFFLLVPAPSAAAPSVFFLFVFSSSSSSSPFLPPVPARSTPAK
jgi:hypothetical protein